jgi:molybdate transport system substrate-binding protein
MGGVKIFFRDWGLSMPRLMLTRQGVIASLVPQFFFCCFSINNIVTVEKQQHLLFTLFVYCLPWRIFISNCRYVFINISVGSSNMNIKYLTIILLTIIVCASALGYAYYNGTFSSSSPSPTPSKSLSPSNTLNITPAPSSIVSPVPTLTPTTSTTISPTMIISPSPTSSVTISPTTTPTSLLTPTPTSAQTNTPAPSPIPTATPPPTELRVFVASSLVNVVQNYSQTFEKTNNCKIIVNSGGSNSLYQQITSGSPCDVFMSADFKWTKQLNISGLLYDNYKNFTTNSLEVLLPKDNPQNIASLLDLVKPGIKIVIADTSVPAGSYTNTTLAKIDAILGNSSSPQYLGPEWINYRSRFLLNVVSYEVTVEDVVSKVSLGLGIADVGVAFVSDAVYGTNTGAQLSYIQIPSAVNTQGTYGIAVIGNTANSDMATKYVNFWVSNEGKNLLQSFGFGS